VYGCLRSSSQLEGYHLHLRQLRAAGAMSASPRHQDALMNAFDWRWIVRSLVARGQLPINTRHHQLDQIDAVHNLSAQLVNKKKLAANWVDGWRPLPDGCPTMKQGIAWALELAGQRVNQSINAEPAAAPIAPLPSRRQNSTEWLAAISCASLRGRFTAEDIAAVLGDAKVTSAEELVRVAAARGISLSESLALRWRDTVEADVGALAVLSKKHSFFRAQAAQRRPVAAPTGPSPDRRHAANSAAAAAAAAAVDVPLQLGLSRAAPFQGSVEIEPLVLAADPAAPGAAAAAAADVDMAAAPPPPPAADAAADAAAAAAARRRAQKAASAQRRRKDPDKRKADNTAKTAKRQRQAASASAAAKK